MDSITGWIFLFFAGGMVGPLLLYVTIRWLVDRTRPDWASEADHYRSRGLPVKTRWGWGRPRDS